MSVNATSSTNASLIASAASGYINQVASTGTQSSAMQEASETPATTAQEAAKGDKVAIKLLAKQQQEKQLENPTPAQEPGKGLAVDQKA